MTDKVKKYLDGQNSIIERYKEKKLIELGLTEKEYAPDNQSSYIYNKSEIVDGEKRYFRYVAIKVTDDEYEQIIAKEKQIDAIYESENKRMQREGIKSEKKIDKKWVPVYELPVDEGSETADARYKDGKSTCATALRVFAWLIMIGAIVAGLIVGIDLDEFWITMVCCVAGGLNMTIMFAIAEILDRLAEISAIARNGIKEKVDK